MLLYSVFLIKQLQPWLETLYQPDIINPKLLNSSLQYTVYFVLLSKIFVCEIFYLERTWYFIYIYLYNATWFGSLFNVRHSIHSFLFF